MKIQAKDIEASNERSLNGHLKKIDDLNFRLDQLDINKDEIIKRLQKFQVAIPSWALGTGGTRFGRFSIGGEPTRLEQKIDDIGILHSLTQSAGAVSLHIPWDIPSDANAIKQKAADYGLVFDAVNSNTFQDQANQAYSYKFGSLCHTEQVVRDQAIAHNIEVIEIGKTLGSKSLTVWLADGSSFPGQNNFRKAYQRTQASLQT